MNHIQICNMGIYSKNTLSLWSRFISSGTVCVTPTAYVGKKKRVCLQSCHLLSLIYRLTTGVQVPTTILLAVYCRLLCFFLRVARPKFHYPCPINLSALLLEQHVYIPTVSSSQPDAIRLRVSDVRHLYSVLFVNC